MFWPAKPVSPAMQWDDPLAVGLMLYQVYTDGAGLNAVDLARNRRATFTGGTGSILGPGWTRGHAGPELNFIGGAPEVRYLSCATDGLPVGSFDCTVVVAYRSTNIGLNNYFFQYGSGSGTNTMFGLGTDSQQLRMTHWSAGQNTVTPINTANGVPHVTAWTHRAVGSAWVPYFDCQAMAGFTLALAIPANPMLNVGSVIGAANLNYAGQLAMVGFWGRVLAAAEIERISTDPFLLARRRSTPELWAVAATPPGQPAMRRWGGIPGMHGAGRKGRGW